MKRLFTFTVAMALAWAAPAANASLIDRGNGLIYDDVLNITWMQDARFSVTHTFGVAGIENGLMTWNTAGEWINAMNAANYLGFSSWRMPTVRPVNGVSFDYAVSYNGETDKGYNNHSTSNELSHLYYSTLGNLGLCSTNNAVGSPADDCVPHPYGTWGLKNTGPFINFLSGGRIWTNVSHENPDEDRAFDFYPEHGVTGTGGKSGPKYVWAVLEGDVAASAVVPVPAAGWLLMSGVLGLVATSRTRSAKGSRNSANT